MAKPVYKLVRPAIVLLKALAATYRVEFVHGEVESGVYGRGEVPIFCSWHQRLFTGIILKPRQRPIAVMVSQSQDGDFISKIIGALGWHVVRGSSSRGGSKALRELMGCLKQGIAVTHIVDGPRGPFGEIKPGLMSLAQLSGMPIVPVIISPERKWVFNSWDRFMVPRPFSRVRVRLDSEIYVPRRLGKDETDELRKRIELRLHELYEEADASWSSASTSGKR
jgi:hypothetical protein